MIQRVNQDVNNSIKFASNRDLFGSNLVQWHYPINGKGDDATSAIWKRKLLQDLGIPRQALLLTLVYNVDGERHLVLTVKTDRGEFILDSTSSAIFDLTKKSTYVPIKRQSQTDPNTWLALGPRSALSPSAAYNGTPVPFVPNLSWGMSKAEAKNVGFMPLIRQSSDSDDWLGKESFDIGGLDYRLELHFGEDKLENERVGDGLNFIRIRNFHCTDDLQKKAIKFLSNKFKLTAPDPIIVSFIDTNRHGKISISQKCEFGMSTISITRDR